MVQMQNNLCTPLQTPYDGPYAILHRSSKHFTIQIGNRQDNVSIDRLTPAYVDKEDATVQIAQPLRRGPLLQTSCQ